MRILKHLLLLFLLSLFSSVGAAQEFKNTSTPNNLVLEVTFFKGKPSVQQKIGEDRNTSNWVWYSLFQGIPGWQPKSGDFPVRAVKLVPFFENNLVKIRVTVFTGEKFHDKEVLVADLEIRENERKSVEKLTEFGVEPFELAVVQNFPSVASLPTVINKTKSLQVIVKPSLSLLPNFNLNLLNNSNKPVIAFAFETMVGNQRMASGMPQGQLGEVLIAPFQSFEKAIPNNLETTENEYDNDSDGNKNLSLIISTVVFENGSYEGDAINAARYQGFMLGRKTLLKQTVPLWQMTAESEITSNSLAKLSEQLSTVKEDIDEATFMKLLKEFPAFNEKEKASVRISVQVAIKSTKREMIKDLQEFIKSPNKNTESIQNWLNESKAKYQSWLTRLNR